MVVPVDAMSVSKIPKSRTWGLGSGVVSLRNVVSGLGSGIWERIGSLDLWSGV